MLNRYATHKRPALPRKQTRDRQTTRQALLEAAGHVFAEYGPDRATGKEIRERAGAGTAAVNYHFGSMEGLYAAVMLEAADRVVAVEAVSTDSARSVDPESTLRAIFESCVGAIQGPITSSWEIRVLGREVISPSPALEALRKRVISQKSQFMRSIVGGVMGLSPDHPAVARGCLTTFTPLILLLIGDRTTLERTFPGAGLRQNDGNALVDHMMRYALAGLAAVAEDARKLPQGSNKTKPKGQRTSPR